MRRGWRRLANRAANAAFDGAELGQALNRALAEDLRAEGADSLVRRARRVLDDSHDDLFGESTTERLEALRADAAHGALASVVLDCAIQAVDDGRRGNEVLETSVENALLERAATGQRQVEEHMLRESSVRNARVVRKRIEDAIAGAEMGDIARRFIGPSDARAPRGPVRKTGIDDGVSLP